MTTLRLTEPLRQKLKQPLGEVIPGQPSFVNAKLKDIIRKEKPFSIILVGDTIARNAAEIGVTANVVIVDDREMRRTVNRVPLQQKNILRTRNSPGTISPMAWATVNEAISRGNSAVIVDGEEDLLALTAILSAAEGSFVVYGQPGEGVVVVRVSQASRGRAQSIVDEMEKSDD